MTEFQNTQTNGSSGDIELFVSRSLRIGVLISASVIISGLLFFIGAGNGGYPNDTYPTTLSEIIQGLLALKPYAIILTGLMLLIATPVLRVGVSILVFAKEKDWLYVGISTLVFVILLCSFFFGK